MSRSKVLFFTSGSIAAFKAAQVVSALVKDGVEVQCVATRAALNFVGSSTWEGLTGKKVLCDLWEEGHAMDHIHLSRTADYGILCPATANTLAKLALGLADDLLTSMLLAWPADKPLYIFPSMNTAMLNAPTTKEHIARLKARGFFVSDTGEGTLACGESGEGRLLEPEQILKIIKPTAKGRVLVTGGATREAVDGIRYLSNVSTGQTAADLCDQFSRAGFQVTYVHGRDARQPKLSVKTLPFSDCESLERALRAELGGSSYQAVIHAAAVSDFTVDKVNGQNPKTGHKLDSGEGLTLTFRPTRKLLPLLKEFSKHKDIQVFGFKLTLGANEDDRTTAVAKVLSENVDGIVANDWSQVDHARDLHPGTLYTGEKQEPFTNHREMAQLLINKITKDGL